MGYIPAVYLGQERADLIPAMQDLRVAGRMPLIDNGNLGIVGVQPQHGLDVAALHPLPQHV
jgi:hypothetical protein